MLARRSSTCTATLRFDTVSSRGVHNIPCTFSINKTLGDKPSTLSKNASTSRLLGLELDQLLRFALEKPWHGGPPIRTSTSPYTLAIAFRRSLAFAEQRFMSSYSDGVVS